MTYFFKNNWNLTIKNKFKIQSMNTPHFEICSIKFYIKCSIKFHLMITFEKLTVYSTVALTRSHRIASVNLNISTYQLNEYFNQFQKRFLNFFAFFCLTWASINLNFFPSNGLKFIDIFPKGTSSKLPFLS